jgi:hypothetical protein
MKGVSFGELIDAYDKMGRQLYNLRKALVTVLVERLSRQTKRALLP